MAVSTVALTFYQYKSFPIVSPSPCCSATGRRRRSPLVVTVVLLFLLFEGGGGGRVLASALDYLNADGLGGLTTCVVYIPQGVSQTLLAGADHFGNKEDVLMGGGVKADAKEGFIGGGDEAGFW